MEIIELDGTTITIENDCGNNIITRNMKARLLEAIESEEYTEEMFDGLESQIGNLETQIDDLASQISDLEDQLTDSEGGDE